VRVHALNASLGLWLFLSAFLWPHTHVQGLNAEIVGMLVVTAAIAGLGGAHGMGRLNALLGAWLIISALLLPRLGMATFWNHVAVGSCIVFFGLGLSRRRVRRHGPLRY
jgi:hypothetical protein